MLYTQRNQSSERFAANNSIIWLHDSTLHTFIEPPISKIETYMCVCWVDMGWPLLEGAVQSEICPKSQKHLKLWISYWLGVDDHLWNQYQWDRGTSMLGLVLPYSSGPRSNFSPPKDPYTVYDLYIYCIATLWNP